MTPNDAARHALLGLLTLGDMSGYELRQLIQRSIGHFWNESFGQIYPTLHALAEEGLIKPVKPKSAPTGRERQVYGITAAGREALAAWLPKPTKPQVPRNELLLKLFFARQGPPEAAIAHLEAARDKAAQDLAAYQATARQLQAEMLQHPDLPYWLMTLRRGELTAEADLTWAEETLASLRERKH